MTSEEWSLRGKELLYIDGVLYGEETISREEYERKYGKTDLTELVIPTKEELVKAKKIYFAEDIETLRQKLIEDLDNQIKSIGMFPADTDCRKTCKEIIISELRNVRNIINKRFGVKE